MVLLAHGAPVAAADAKGRTPLHYAVESSSAAVATAILQTPSGRVVANHLDRKARSALHCAAQMGDLNLVKLLVQFGCDIDVEEYKGHTPLDVARYFGNVAVAQFLALRGAVANKTVPGVIELAHGDDGAGEAPASGEMVAARVGSEAGWWAADVEAGFLGASNQAKQMLKGSSSSSGKTRKASSSKASSCSNPASWRSNPTIASARADGQGICSQRTSVCNLKGFVVQTY